MVGERGSAEKNGSNLLAIDGLLFPGGETFLQISLDNILSDAIICFNESDGVAHDEMRSQQEKAAIRRGCV